jgi:hypothetical protein
VVGSCRQGELSAVRGPTIFQRLRRRYERIAWVSGILAHALLFSWLLWESGKGLFVFPEELFLHHSRMPPVEIRMIDLSAEDAVPGMPAVGMDPASAKTLIGRRTQELQGLSEEERLRRLNEAVGKAGVVREKSVGEIAGLMGVDPSHYQPKKNPPPGPFDFDTATVHALEKIRNEKGEPGYRITFVDRAGRTLEGEEFGPATRTWDTLYNVLKMAKENPAFGALYHQLVKPMLAEMAQREAEAKNALPAPKPKKKTGGKAPPEALQTPSP